MNNIKKKEQVILSFTICLLISYAPVLTFVNSLFNYYTRLNFVYDTLLVYLILLYFIIRSLLIIVKRIKKDVFAFTLMFFIVFLLTYLLFPQNRTFMFTSFSDVLGNPFYVLFIFSFTGYVFIRYIDDYGIFIDQLRKASLVVVVCSIITFFIQLNHGEVPQYMVFSYNMTLQSLFLVIIFFEKKRMIDLTIGLMGFLMILFAGARGPVLVIILVIITYFILRRDSKIKKLQTYSFLIILFLAIILGFNDIIRFLMDISQQLGIESRTLFLILNDSVFDDSGRIIIKDIIIDSYSFWGLGLYGDRVVSGGTYAHDFFVELIAQFGYIGGTFLISIFLLIVKKGIQSRNNCIRDLVIVFLSTGLFKLFLSGSYLNQEPSFYILIGLGVNAMFVNKGVNDENPMVM